MTPRGPHDVRVLPDIESLSRAAAGFIVSYIQRTISARVRFSMVLSGGSTPKRLYELFASSPYRDAVDWTKVHLFWADERCVPPDDPESNYTLAFDAFLNSVAPPSQNIHRIHGEEEPTAAAGLYEEDIRAFFGAGRTPVFDLVLLGAGEDGHTASLFPNSPAVLERTRLAVPVDLDPPNLNRVTLTLPVLNNASHVLFLAAGRRKAGVVHEIMEDGNPKRYPAGLVKPGDGELTWMLDREAAGALTGVVMGK